MKTTLLVILATLLTGCMSMGVAEMGMSERDWLRRTLVADVAYRSDGITAYKAKGSFFHFRDGRLVKIDQNLVPAETIRSLPEIPSGAGVAQQ